MSGTIDPESTMNLSELPEFGLARLGEAELDLIEKRSIVQRRISACLQVGAVLAAVGALLVFVPIHLSFGFDTNSIFHLGLKAFGAFFALMFLGLALEQARLYVWLEVLAWVMIPVGLCAQLISREAATACWWLPAEMYAKTGRYGNAAWLWRRGIVKSAGDEHHTAETLTERAVYLNCPRS